MLELNKNLLINGNKYYSQRKPTGQVTPTTSYQYLTVDRFCQKITGTITTPTVEASSDFPVSKTPWCSKYTGTTAATSSISEQQRIEADFGLELIGDYVSYLGYVTSTSYSKATVNIGYATAKDNHATQTLLFTKDFNLATDGSVNELKWPKIAQLSSLISTGLYVEIVLSTPTNTSTSSTHRIGGQTLVRGRYTPTETLLAARSLQDEIRYCQRYFEPLNGSITSAWLNSNSYCHWLFKVIKRSTPIVTGSLQPGCSVHSTTDSLVVYIASSGNYSGVTNPTATSEL